MAGHPGSLACRRAVAVSSRVDTSRPPSPSVPWSRGAHARLLAPLSTWAGRAPDDIECIQLVHVDQSGGKAPYRPGETDKPAFGPRSGRYGLLWRPGQERLGGVLHVVEGLADGLRVLRFMGSRRAVSSSWAWALPRPIAAAIGTSAQLLSDAYSRSSWPFWLSLSSHRRGRRRRRSWTTWGASSSPWPTVGPTTAMSAGRTELWTAGRSLVICSATRTAGMWTRSTRTTTGSGTSPTGAGWGRLEYRHRAPERHRSRGHLRGRSGHSMVRAGRLYRQPAGQNHEAGAASAETVTAKRW